MNQKIEALTTAYEYSERLQNGINEVIMYFETDNENKGLNLIIQILDGFNWLVKVIELTRDEQKEEINIYNIKDILNEMVDALENKDYILLKDLLQYEITPILKEWNEKISVSLG